MSAIAFETLYKEQSWDLGDSFSRWVRGVSEPRFLFTLVKENWFTYVVGCHIKHVQVDEERVEVVRVFHPGCEGIALIEGCPKLQVYALAETGSKNCIAIHRADQNEDVLLATLTGQPDYEYRSVQFVKQELLFSLTGAPHFTIFIWKWATEEQLIAVKTLEGLVSTNIVISPVNHRLWAEWSPTHLTFYELQEYTENSVTMTEIDLPPNATDLLYPDTARAGEPFLYDILSVAWTHAGDLFALSNLNSIHHVDVINHKLYMVGQLDDFGDEPDANFTRIESYDSTCLAALADNGLFLVLQVRTGELMLLKRIAFASGLIKYLPNPLDATSPKKSLYAVTDSDRELHFISDGSIRSTVHLADLVLSRVHCACFIERAAEFVAAVTEDGSIFILDTATGNIQAKWSFSFVACSIKCHPVMPFVAVGTVNGYVYYIDVKNVRRPKIIFQVFLMRAVLNKLEWVCRGRLLIAADSDEGYLFMLQGYVTTDFDYLDCAHVAGFIRSINAPWHYRDQRLQVLSNYHRQDEVPFLLNNFRLHTDHFELVCSQQIGAPVSSLAFSPFARFLLAFTYTSRQVGLVHFHDHMKAGYLKEPETIYESEQPLSVNHMLIIGGHLFAFGINGLATVHPNPTSIKSEPLATQHVVQTHLPGNGGIREGVVSMNGAAFIAFGFDKTITFVRLRTGKAPQTDWNQIGYGADFPKVIDMQRKYYTSLKPNPDVGTIREGEEDGRGVIWDLSQAEEQEMEARYQPEKEDMLAELGLIRQEVQALIEENNTRKPEEQLAPEKFEINQEAHEDLAKECEARLTHLKIVLSSLYEVREEWIQRTTHTTYTQFATPICTISGYHDRRTIQNYVQQHETYAGLQEVLGIKHTRRLERKLKRAAFDIYNHALHLNVKWTTLEERLKRRQSRNLLVDLQPQARRALEEMQINASSPVSGMPEPPQPDFYEQLLRQLQATETAEAEEENGDDQSVTVSEIMSVDRRTSQWDRRPSLAVSKFEQRVAAAIGKDQDDDEDENEETRLRINPARIKRLLLNAGIPMSPQALAAFGLITDDIAWQLRDDELEVAVGQRQRHHKYTPRKKRGELLREQMKAHTPPQRNKAPPNLFDKRPTKDETSESRLTIASGLTSVTASASSIESSEEEEEELPPPKPKKQRAVVTGIDPATGKELVEIEDDTSEESSDEHAEEDIDLMEERKLAESVITRDEWTRYEQLTQMLAGSLTWKLHEPSLAFYPQTELFSIQQVRSQMVLIEAEIQKLQDTLNIHFDEAKHFKEHLLKETVSRNQRIAEIYDFFGKRPPLVDFDWVCHCEDMTAQIFEVRDSEVPYEGYGLRGGARAEAQAEEEILMKEAIEERDRELLEMRMNEALVEKRERAAVLREDIPKPEFMVQKDQWDWDYDEYVQADAYYHEVDKHEQLRTTFKSELALELRKLLKKNKMARRLIDHAAHSLLSLKIIVERCIRMEELKWLRLQKHVFEYFRLQREFDAKKRVLAKEQDKIKYTQEVAAQLQTRVEECTRLYDEILERDHGLELTFRADMGRDVSKFHIEQFLKLYNKRPKLLVPHSQLLPLILTMVKALQTPDLRWFAHENGDLGQKAVNAIYEFDNAIHNPPGCPRSTWERFVHFRRERLLCEYEAKAAAADLVQLQNALEQCEDRLEEFSDNLATVLADVATHRQLILDLVHDMELQLIMKAGHVQLPRALTCEDFDSVVLLPQDDVDVGNAKTATEGGRKLKTLRGIIRTHQQLKQTEYKYRRAQLTEKHLGLKHRDILQMRVSKEILDFIRAGSFDNFKHEQDQKMTRVHVFEKMTEKFHKRLLRAHRRLTHMFRRLAARKETDNKEKDALLDKRNELVNAELSMCPERQNPEAMARFHEERVRMLMQLGNMMRSVATNAATIYQLETELDRLYRKTYPVL